MIEKILSRIDEISELIRPVGWSRKIEVVETKAVREIVQEVAKDGGWVSVKDRLPEVQDEYLVWWTADGFKGKCFYEIVEYSPEEGWIGKIPQAPFGKYTVIAWMPLPSAPYQKGE